MHFKCKNQFMACACWADIHVDQPAHLCSVVKIYAIHLLVNLKDPNCAVLLRSMPFTYLWTLKIQIVVEQHILWSGPSCSKLTISLVNDSLKFKSSHTQICWNFCSKMLLTFFQQKISEYCVLNPLKQLTKWPLTSSLS